MTSIEVTAPQEKPAIIPVNTRDIFIDMANESREAGDHANAELFDRLANAPTTDEMRLEKFGTPLPENHPIAPKYRKIGATALR